MKDVPPWAWVGAAALLGFVFYRRATARAVVGDTGRPVRPAYTGTGDKTAQNPKAVPWSG